MSQALYLGFKSTKASSHHSLSPGKAARRDELLQTGKTVGLDQNQSQELQLLLQEDARDDLANGIIAVLVFVAIAAAIKVVVDSMAKK